MKKIKPRWLSGFYFLEDDETYDNPPELTGGYEEH